LKETNQFVYSNAEFADSFYVNSLGFRDDEISLERPEIICAGDSYTLGWGVKQNETFAQLIEKESGLKVLNASMSSYGTARESVAMKKIDPSGIKFIIWQYAPNDADENNAYIDSSYNYSAPSEKQYSSTQQTHLWATKYFPGKHFLTLTKLFAGSLVRKSYEEWKKSSLSPRDEAKNFLDILKNTGINPRVKLIVFELSNYQMKNEFTNELKLLLRNDYAKSILQNIQVLDFSTLLKKEDYYLLDDHINESGHKKIAEVLLNAVKKSAD
ncbi:MAG TPA: hypothetical protein VJT83_01460, partial [Chitinophagaceae bacterium]|nr:hypothetical protein [Chitinophagaceae bacterium]